MSTETIFALTSARSGTMSLYKLLKRNAPQLTVVHETNNNPWNPPMFGRTIYDHTTGNLAAVRAALRRKRRAVDCHRTPAYIETSHAFLKSYWDLSAEFFPHTKAFHLIRHPLEVARSEENREQWMADRHAPLCRYRGRDGRLYRRWALTELEPIFAGFDLAQLTVFQRYLIQWIEIENRAMEFLRRFDMHHRCLTLYTPQDLNDPRLAGAVLDFVGAEHRADISLPGAQNRSHPGYETVLGDAELRQCREVIDELPATYLEIFEREPYRGQPWVGLLSKSRRAERTPAARKAPAP